MYPRSQPENFLNLIEAGKESYYIVSQFNLFEYAREAPLFEKLAERFETCVHGINLVRGELDKLHALPISDSAATEAPDVGSWPSGRERLGRRKGMLLGSLARD